MIVSRGLPALRALQKLKVNNTQVTQIIRNSHIWSYRVAPPPASKRIQLLAELVQGFAWWWVLWHLWTEPGHILGEFEYPDASKWTDEELGIES
ncbi:hypothetical protein NQ318_012274 [Aromia moschata]|uniref:NADH dehydrogenase [ubiquinone] 1 beta subcomplex subunit 2, mitochondrial n=1 Tax=Aromia moschata TaxID=1265417 RepID=A0AAV8XGS0_9CUCU|nr:hypothetical protein NQ318_012274 [Aromia moschata]